MLSLTTDNYYSQEANQIYWSASFVKSMLDCPARAMAELNGAYIRPQSVALTVGRYVDSYFEGTLDSFCTSNPDIFKRDGSLKLDYLRANDMIERASRDDVFMDYMQGEKQAIKTGMIGGILFKCKMDVYQPGKRIVDLKTCKDMEPMYRSGEGKLSFADYWRWTLQMSIYQTIEGNKLPCYLAVITKQTPPDIAVIEIPQHFLDAEMEVMLGKLPYLDAMRNGIIEPERCEKCDYCRESKRLSGAISLEEFE